MGKSTFGKGGHAIKERRKLKTGHIVVREFGADPRKIDELDWLVNWSKSNGLEQYIGEIVGSPELVFEHAAGRVYKIKTTDNGLYFIVVGNGYPTVYSAGKELNEPEEILSFHRGSRLISKLKVVHAKKKRNSRQKGIVLQRGE